MPRRVKSAGGRSSSVVLEPQAGGGGGGGGSTDALLAHGFGEVTGTPASVGNGTDSIICSVTVTPRVTGKFRVIGMACLTNGDGSTHGVTLKVGHGSGPTVDYTGGSVTVEAGVVRSGTVEFETTAFPIGVPVQIDLIGNASGPVVSVVPHAGQITVQELSN